MTSGSDPADGFRAELAELDAVTAARIRNKARRRGAPLGPTPQPIPRDTHRDLDTVDDTPPTFTAPTAPRQRTRSLTFAAALVALVVAVGGVAIAGRPRPTPAPSPTLAHLAETAAYTPMSSVTGTVSATVNLERQPDRVLRRDVGVRADPDALTLAISNDANFNEQGRLELLAMDPVAISDTQPIIAGFTIAELADLPDDPSGLLDAVTARVARPANDPAVASTIATLAGTRIAPAGVRSAAIHALALLGGDVDGWGTDPFGRRGALIRGPGEPHPQWVAYSDPNTGEIFAFAHHPDHAHPSGARDAAGWTLHI